MNDSRNESRQSRILKGFARLVSGTMVSRITGMLREMTMAYYLGSGAAMDAFVVGFTLPNLFRRILGEKVLESALMPTYKQITASGNQEDANNLIKTMLFLLIAIGSFITGLGIAITPTLVNLFAPGFDPETQQMAVIMTRIMFPFLIVISVASMFGVILQTRERFGMYGLAPALFNVAVIVILWIGMSRFGPTTAAFGVLIGGILEAIVMVPIVRETFHFHRAKIDVKHPAVKQVNRLALPVLLETILDKTIVLVDRRLASVLSAGSIAALGYSFRLLQLPYGILVLGIARTYYQHLVDAADDIVDFTGMISNALKLTMAIMIPCAAGLAVFSDLFVRVVFQRGAFDEEAVRLTASAFACYSLGMIGMTAMAILSRAFNAVKDTSTPVKISVFMMLINIALNYILVETPLRHAGLALASSVAYSFAGISLLILIRRKLQNMTDQTIRFHLVTPFLKILIASLVAAGVSSIILRYVGEKPEFLESMVFLVVGGGLFVGVYYGCLILLKLPLRQLLSMD
ncbi:murein biosynthesis integral membrane protein MurJ [bacterium]|nr:murein biosynthesis integral membrane protein MurJ [candidate division CSSED10-310 bacterium]